MRKIDDWNGFLHALDNDMIRVEVGARAIVVYDSVHTDRFQQLDGEITATYDSLGHPFHLDGKKVEGWHVCTRNLGRNVGQVISAKFEEKDDD